MPWIEATGGAKSKRSPDANARRAPATARFAFFLSLCNRRLEILKQEVQLVWIKPLGLLAIERAAQFLHQVLKPLVPGFEFSNLVGDRRSVLFSRSRLLLARRNQRRLRRQDRPHLRRKSGKFSSSERLGHEPYYTVLRAP